MDGSRRRDRETRVAPTLLSLSSKAAAEISKVAPLARPSLLGGTALGAAYLLRFCTDNGIPFPLSLGELPTLLLLLLALTAFGTLAIGGFLVMPVLTSQISFRRRKRGEFFVWLVFPLMLGFGLLTLAGFHRPTVLEGWVEVGVFFAVLASCAWVSAWRRVRRQRPKWFFAFFSVSLLSFVWTSLLLLPLLKVAISIANDSTLQSAVFVAGFLLLLGLLNAQLRAARSLRQGSPKAKLRLATSAMILFAILPGVPLPAASFMTEQALRVLSIGGYQPVRLVFSSDAAKAGIPDLLVSGSTPTSCTVYMVFETGTTYQVRKTADPRSELWSIPASAAWVRRGALPHVPCQRPYEDLAKVVRLWLGAFHLTK